MSEPKRYKVGKIGTTEMIDCVSYADYARLKAEVEELQGLLTASTYYNTSDEVTRLKAEVERLEEGNKCLDQMHEKEMARSAFLCEQVERLTKAVMHSPAAQLKLKELEGKTTYEEINGKIPPCIDKYEAK